MTIGIGALCCTKSKHSTSKVGLEEEIRPDAIVMIADTMGSTDYDSTDDLHKMYVCPKEKLFGVCAGHIEMCGEIIEIIRKEILALTEERNHGTMLQILNKALYGHRQQHFQWDVLSQNFLPVPGA